MLKSRFLSNSTAPTLNHVMPLLKVTYKFILISSYLKESFLIFVNLFLFHVLPFTCLIKCKKSKLFLYTGEFSIAQTYVFYHN